MTTTNGDEMVREVHPFEKAGLGRAPFRFIGVEVKIGPIMLDDGMTMVGSPGQPMGTCAYCGNGIAECCHIRDADGKTFIVGNVCVNKTADKPLISKVKLAMRKRNAEKRKAREAARIERMLETFAREDVKAVLATTDSPNAYRAAERGETALCWAEFMVANAGNKGKIEVARKVEAIAKGIEAGEIVPDFEAARNVVELRDAARRRREEAAARLEQERQDAERKNREASAWLIGKLREARSTPFVESIIADLESGRPAHAFPNRALDILSDIVGKLAGRSGSKAYDAAVEEFDNHVAR